MQLRSTKNERHPEPLVYNVRQLAAVLDVSTRSIYALAKRGEIPYVRIGDRLLFPRAAIEQWLAQRAARTIDNMRTEANNADDTSPHCTNAITEIDHDGRQAQDGNSG